ncbi:MAG: FAD-dependent oxidoreductase [Myxococcota bacterium]
MLTDARSLSADTTLDADVCIIGAGPAGLTLALELRGLRVVLLESGGFYPAPATQTLAEGEVAGEPYWALETSRLRCFGGTSAHWTGWCRPLDRGDFEARPWVEESGWPFAYDELVPYYHRAQAVCGLGEFDYDAARWAQRLGFSLLPLDKSSLVTSLWQLSRPIRFGEAYRDAIASSPDVQAYLHATVTELHWLPRSQRVELALARTLEGRSLRVRAQVFVIAAGGIDNARLLLASNAPYGIGNGNGLVGRFFLEHPHAAIGIVLAQRSEAWRAYENVFDVPGAAPPAVRATLAIAPEVQRRERLLNSSVGIEPLQGVPAFSGAAGMTARLLARKFQGIDAGVMFELYARAEQYPSADSYVRLTNQRDAVGMPRVALHWRHHPHTLWSMRRSLELIAEAFGAAHIGRLYSYMHDGPRRIGAFPEIFGGYHHMGTTRMHADARRGVVDANCRVHGTGNLFVAGSSVFPNGGYANPTLTLVALALRLADFLKRSSV